MTCASNIVNEGHGKKEGNVRCEGLFPSLGGYNLVKRSLCPVRKPSL